MQAHQIPRIYFLSVGNCMNSANLWKLLDFLRGKKPTISYHQRQIGKLQDRVLQTSMCLRTTWRMCLMQSPIQ